MERVLTAMPSLSSSPRMRSVPQCGFSRAMVAISVRTSGFKRGRPQGAAGTPAPEEAPALAMPAQHGLGADQEEVASPVPLEAVDEKPEELVSGAEARQALVTEGDLELLAEEQVLEEEALAAAQGFDERGQEEPEEFDHRGRIADRHHLAGRRKLMAPYSFGML